jgi:hypothetical protein
MNILDRVILTIISTILTGCIAQSANFERYPQVYVSHHVKDAKNIKFSRDVN